MKCVEVLFKYVAMSVVLFVIVGSANLFALESSSPPPSETMELVNDYWIDNNSDGRRLDPGRSTYQLGNLALYRTFCLPDGPESLAQAVCDKYIQHTLNWASRHEWKLHDARKVADNQAVGQVHLELYELCQLPSLSSSLREHCGRTSGLEKLEAISESVDETIICIRNPQDSRCRARHRYDWSWSDAVFMGGPVFSKFGDDSSLPHTLGYSSLEYFDMLLKLFNDSKEDVYGLYDESEDLWYRDTNSIYCPEPAPSPKPGSTTRCRTQNNKKSFWSRGNGWVMAALPRILDDNPPDDVFRKMLRDMASSIKNRQRSDGFWNVSLDDDNDFPGPETTGTAAFAYAIAWGINNGILDDATYRPVVIKAWDAMVRDAVQSDGKLGYVQRAANEPCDWMHPDQQGRSPFSEPCTWNERDDAFVRELTDAYGVGLFLLAGSEVAKLLASDSTACTAFLIVQAETADFGRGSRHEDEHAGFHGTGYVNFPRNRGYVEWREMDGGPGGLTTLSFRHALRPSSSRTASLIVNGEAQDIRFDSTGSWTNWQQLPVEVRLNPGPDNIIRIEAVGQDSANIDEMSVAYQAEDDRVAIGGRARVESNHAGHHGTGFVNFPRNRGFIEWSDVDGGESGEVTLRFRHALGAPNPRTALLIINGVQQDIRFEPTGAWTNWRELDVDVSLNPGSVNTVRIETNGQDSANIDELLVLDHTP